MIYIFGGLPATGKTTLAKMLAQHSGATYLRIDTIENALKESGETPSVQVSGYAVAYEIAKDNLALGQDVVADSVNPIEITRAAWRRCSTEHIEIEVVCSDLNEHRRRVETRDHITVVHWQGVVEREYHPWPEAQVVIDTAGELPESSFARLLERLD